MSPISRRLSRLIQQVFNALAAAEQAATAPPRAEPAVAVKRSVSADHIVCLDCGKHLSMLKRHLMTDHKLTPEQYRQRWELPFISAGRPELCEDGRLPGRGEQWDRLRRFWYVRCGRAEARSQPFLLGLLLQHAADYGQQFFLSARPRQEFTHAIGMDRPSGNEVKSTLMPGRFTRAIRARIERA